MAINATIQVRRGLLKDFDPTKMLPGEWAVSIDASTSNQIVWMCFAPGVCKRMGTYEDFKSMISQANGEIIEELRGEFEAILADVESVAKDVSADKEEILVVKSEILDTYIPQIQNYVNTASTHAKNAKASETNAKTSENNAKVSETNAAESASEAKTYAEQALSTTPDGYNQMVSDVDLLKNSIVQTTDRTLYGSKNGGIKLIGIGGASEQKQYSGAQLLNYDVWKTVDTNRGTTVFENNGVTITATSDDAHTEYSDTFPEGARIEVSEGDIITMTWESDATNANNGNVYIFGNGGVTSKASTLATVKTLSYTVPSGISYITFRFGVITSGNKISYKNIMINKGDTVLPYEPYVGATQSPNPIYPQEIESVGDSGSLTVKAENKNLYDDNDTTNYFSKNASATYSYDRENHMLTITPTGLDSGVYLSASSRIVKNLRELLSKNDSVTVSMDVKSSSKNVPIKMGNDSAVGTFIAQATPTWQRVSFVIPYNIVYASGSYNFVVYANSNTDYETFYIKNIQYEIGTVATPYEPYRSKSITIPLNEPLRKGDEIAVIDGAWGVLHGKGKEVVDGNTELYTHSTTNGKYRYSIPNLVGKVVTASSNNVIEDILCTHYTAVTGADTWNEVQGVAVSADGKVFIYDNDFNTSDTSLYKAQLAENPITVEYPLATPTFEPFTDQTPFYGLESFDTVTYISTDSEVEPNIELKFAKTEGDAVTLLNYNQTNLNRIAIAELTSAVLALNQE